MSSSINDYPTLEAEAKAFTEAVNQFAALDPFDASIATAYRKLSAWESDLTTRIATDRTDKLTAYVRIIELLPEADDLFARICSAYPEAAEIRRHLRSQLSGLQ